MALSAFGVEDNRISKSAHDHVNTSQAAGINAAVGGAAGAHLARGEFRSLAARRAANKNPKAIGDGRSLPALRGSLSEGQKAMKLRRVAAGKVGAGAALGAGVGAAEHVLNRGFKNRKN
jgi:hypothetical protein